MPSHPEPPRSAENDLFGALDPVPGPFGYHADFSRPFGMLERAASWVVRVPSGPTYELYGPFDGRDEAIQWALGLEDTEPWVVEPVRTPEEWPGAALMAPEEPETPLLDLIAGRGLTDSVKPLGPDASIESDATSGG